MVEFDESGMSFAFEEDNIFYIEKSALYRRLNGKGVACVECIVLQNDKICFLEAKKSIPISRNDEIDIFWSQIRKKNIDSVLLLNRCIIENDIDEIGNSLKDVFCGKHSTIFVLVINGINIDMCQAFSAKFKKWIKDLQAIYGAEVVVLNEELAKKSGMIKSVINS